MYMAGIGQKFLNLKDVILKEILVKKLWKIFRKQ
jgi:hypothetical protein